MEIKYKACDYFEEYFILSENFKKLSNFWLTVEMLMDNENKIITVNRWSGMKDNNNFDIFERDLVEITLSNGQIKKAIVEFIDGCFIVSFYESLIIDGKYKNSDYLKCYVVNHAVKLQDRNKKAKVL